MIRPQNLWQPLVLTFGCILLPAALAATSGTTNDAGISYVAPSISLESTRPSEIFAERFFQELLATDSLVFDRFVGPSQRLGWERIENKFGYAGVQQLNGAGARLFESIGMDSLRTAVVDALPIGQWPDQWEGRFGEFLAGTLGNPEEEHVFVTSAGYSAVRTTWERENEKAGFQWGVRPWRTSPYVYFLAHAGWLDKRPLFILEGRGGYTFFGATRLESRLTLQLPAALRLAAFGGINPGRFNSQAPGTSNFGVTLERVIQTKGHIPESVFFLGFRSLVSGTSSNPQPESLFIAGFSQPW